MMLEPKAPVAVKMVDVQVPKGAESAPKKATTPTAPQTSPAPSLQSLSFVPSKSSSVVDWLESQAEGYLASMSSRTPTPEPLSFSRPLTPVPQDFDGIALARAPSAQEAQATRTQTIARRHSIAVMQTAPFAPSTEAQGQKEDRQLKDFREALTRLKQVTRPARRAMLDSVIISAVIGAIVGTVIGCTHLGPLGLGVGITGIALSLLFALPLGWIQGRMQQRALLEDPEVQKLLLELKDIPENLSQDELAQAKGLIRFMEGNIFEQSILPQWLKKLGSGTSQILKLQSWAAPVAERWVVPHIDRFGSKMGKKIVALKAEAEAAREKFEATRAGRAEGKMLQTADKGAAYTQEQVLLSADDNEDALLALRLAEKLGA